MKEQLPCSRRSLPRPHFAKVCLRKVLCGHKQLPRKEKTWAGEGVFVSAGQGDKGRCGWL